MGEPWHAPKGAETELVHFYSEAACLLSSIRRHSVALLFPTPLSPDLSRIQESLVLVIAPVHRELREG